MKLSLMNKHAIICGSTDGIGKASALLLANQGCEITLVARNQDKLDKTQSELNIEHNQKHHSVCADFDNPMDLKSKIKMHIDSLDRSVDVLVNNSGGRVVAAVVALDREEKNEDGETTKERLQAELDIPIQSIASISKLTSFLEEDGNFQEQANLIKNYYSE